MTDDRPTTAPGMGRRPSFQIRHRAPGPGAYVIPSGIGKQVTSTLRTSATLSFGTGPRAPDERNGEAPGPGAYHKTAPIGTSSVSTIKRAPQYTMRAREKFGSTVDGASSTTPGPGAYTNVDNPKQRSPPAYSMTGRNFPDFSSKKLTPAPGAYTSTQSVGKQPVSTRPTAPTVKFDKSQRTDGLKPQSHVGPGQYSIIPSLGSQVVSGKRSAPAVTMSSRPKERAMDTGCRAGPGSYKPLEGFGSQAVSQFRSNPAVTISGRTLFGSPYNF